MLFDLDGTLRLNSPGSHEMALRIIAALGHQIDEETHRAIIRWEHAYWADRDQVLHDKQRCPDPLCFWSSYFARYVEVLSIPPEDAECAARSLGRYFAEEYQPTGRLAPGARDVLLRLRSKGVILGLVSNRPEPLTGVAIELGILEYFDFTLAAGQIGRWKPDPAIFEKALALAGGVSPTEAIYIGDNYYTDIIGAHRLGIRPILLDEHQAFREIAGDFLVVKQLSDLAAMIPD
ncbi:MAG: hypothetical protein Kow00124_15280 [Anaerolineae bacterium]